MKFIIKHIFINNFDYMAHFESAYRRSGTCAFFMCQNSFFPLNKIKQFLFNSTASIFLYTYYLFLAFKNISSKNIRIIKKIVLTCDIWQRSITSQPLSNYLFKMDRL